jgi:hypothetical protein
MSASFPHTPSTFAFDVVQLVCIDISGVLRRSAGGAVVGRVAGGLIGVERVRGVEQSRVGQREILQSRVSRSKVAHHLPSTWAHLVGHGDRLLPTWGSLVCSRHVVWWIVVIVVVAMRSRANG